MSGMRFSAPVVEPEQAGRNDDSSALGARAAGLRYRPGLDGLRAVAVIAVLLYHAGLPVPGGFLGVETFFVLSGFLITALLLVEWDAHGRVSLRDFWLRRARRLLPALLFLLAGTLLFTMLRLPNDVADLLTDARAALLYIMNWHLIRGGQSYFDPLLRPPLLQHLWSLAVEEQFYLLWPLLFAAGMRLLRARGMLLMTLLGAVGSLVLMATLYRPGADPSRIYYGTDTRAAGVLLGAALAFLWLPGERSSVAGRRISVLLDCAGVAALAALIGCYFLLPARHPLLYRGGFALVDALTVIILAAACTQGARATSFLLGWKPLREIGLRSYGIYLWHWPIFMVTRPVLDLPLDGLPLLALRLAILAVLVEISYRYVELPIRHGALQNVGRRLTATVTAGQQALSGRPGGDVQRQMMVVLSGCLLAVIVAAVVGVRLSNATEPTSSLLASRVGVTSTPTVTSTVARTAITSVASPPTTAPTALARLTIGSTPVVEVVAAETSPAVPPAPPLTTPLPTAPPLDPVVVAELQRLLDATVVGGYIPGTVLSVSVPGYAPWSGASGLADPGQDLAMQPTTLVRLASITKMFTAVVVLQLAQEQKLNLDTPIDTYLPGLIRFGQSTTVRQLLNHTTGIYDYQADIRFFAEGYENPESVFAPAELVARADQETLTFRPGTPGAWQYSSTNYVILGMLVEQVTGRSLAQEMRARIFDRLGLEHTFFAPQEPAVGSVAQGYTGGAEQVNLSESFVFATGNLVATVDDLRRFGEGLFGGKLLDAPSLTIMTTLIDTYGAFEMPELEYGLGVMGAEMSVGPGPDGRARPLAVRAVLGHIGGIGGFRSALWWAPESEITVALSFNQADVDPNILARDVFEVILTWQGR